MNTPHENCPKGHPMSGRNLIVTNGGRTRRCVTCRHRPTQYHRWVDGKCDICGLPALGTEERTRFNFWSKVEKTASCWLWRGVLYKNGYGQFGCGKGERRAHRLAWLWSGGAIPDGKELDHTCRTPSCVNPSHLRAVTHLENIHAKPTYGFCRKGHRYVSGSFRVQKHGKYTIRRCLVCAG